MVNAQQQREKKTRDDQNTEKMTLSLNGFMCTVR